MVGADMAKSNNDIEEFRKAFRNKRIPILTLDQRWHGLFHNGEKPANIKALESRLNHFLRQQGKMVNEMKDMKKLKKKLMEQIIKNMDVDASEDSRLSAKKLSKSSQLIQDINDKLRKDDNELERIPYQIKEINEELMVQSMKICYEKMKYNEAEIEKLGEWIVKVREELKNRILIKQDMEDQNTEMYSYMHNLLGAEVMEIFDRQQKNDK